MITRMKAQLLYRHRLDFDDGAILEVVIWQLPKPVEGCRHGFKYRLYYGRDGKWLVGFDNERSKGDHCHCGDVETAYVFDGPDKLIDDFFRMVGEHRREG